MTITDNALFYNHFTAQLQACLPAYAHNINIGVACSGGGDSIVLLHLFKKWKEEQAGIKIKLFVGVVDHRLRAGSTEEAKWVKKKGEEWGFPVTILSPNFPIKATQKNARDARYALLAAWAKRHYITHIALAHHDDDQQETVLLRLLGQSGWQGLQGMKSRQILFQDGIISTPTLYLIRPLLTFSKQALLDYADANQLHYMHDPSNDNMNYTRILLRKNRDFLVQQNIDPANIRRLQKAAGRLYHLQMPYLEAIAKNAVKIHHQGLWVELSPRQLAFEKPIFSVILLQAIWQMLAGLAYPPKTKAMGTLLNAILRGEKGGTLAGLSWCRLEKNDIIIIYREIGFMQPAVTLLPQQNNYLIDHRFEVMLDEKTAKKLAGFKLGLVGQGNYQQFFKENSDFKQPSKAIIKTFPCLMDGSGSIILVLGVNYFSVNNALGLQNNSLALKIVGKIPFQFLERMLI